MSIDWNTAPEGATHWKKEGDYWFYWIEGTNKWFRGPSCNVSAEREAKFEARPQEAWDGQGLPPVGIECEYKFVRENWQKVKIFAHKPNPNGSISVLFERADRWGAVAHPDYFRPIRTPEQIAAEQIAAKEREKAIEEMCFAEETLTVKQAKALYEAGYRRQEEEIKRNADRYLWLRNPDQDVSLVLDKVSGEVPADEFGCGGYRTYEYRSGDELDAAIDAAMERRT
ncbi:TPA: hypothetical protein ACRL92_005762 [Pseudomonas aeruginosa]